MNKDTMTATIAAGSKTGITAATLHERATQKAIDEKEARRVMAIQNAANITRTLASNRLAFDVWYADDRIVFFVTGHTAQELRNLLTGFVESEFSFIRHSNRGGGTMTLGCAKLTLTW